MADPKITKVKLSEIKPDLLNANRHTERGHAMLRDSMSEFGFAEAGTLDKDGRVIGGNHRLEVAGDLLQSDEAIVIEVDGKSPVFIKRDDIDLSTPEGRRLAYALNRSAQVSIDFDPERIAVDLAEGINLEGLFYENEIEEMMFGIQENDPYGEWEGLPEYEQEDNFGAVATIKVHFETKDDIDIFSKLIKQSVNENTVYIWFPKKEKEDLTKYQVIDES